VLSPLHPENVVKEQLVVVRRCQPLKAEFRAVDDDFAKLADLGIDPEHVHVLDSPLVWSPAGCRPPTVFTGYGLSATTLVPAA
jgi:hypothetical protein